MRYQTLMQLLPVALEQCDCKYQGLTEYWNVQGVLERFSSELPNSVYMIN